MNGVAGTGPAGRLGDYDVLYEIKAGGMGEVLLARKRGAAGFEKLVALKLIRGELRGRDELRAMFLDEAQLLARIDHPTIAQVYDFGEDGDTLYLAMEYVAGIRFTELIRRDPPPEISARAMAQVCRGLHAAHELTDLSGNPLGVVHRDVTPENLMLTFDGRVKVLDFGIALVRGRTAPVTEFGTIKGKPPYLSPEQIKNSPLDRRTDIFSASVVLHEMLTGEPVFVGESVYAVARAIEHETVEPPSAFVDDVPDGMDAVVMRGMERDPAARYPNARSMADALERVARHGTESLESYARRELAEARDKHTTWLRELIEDIGSSLGATNIGRPSGVMTAASGDALAMAESPLQVTVEPADREPNPYAATERRPGRGRLVVAMAGLLVVVAAIVVAVILMRSNDDDEPREELLAAADIDAGTPPVVAVDAAVVPVVVDDVPATVDAAAAAPVDARRRRAKRDREPERAPPPAPAKPDARAADPVEDITPPEVAQVGFLTVAAKPYALVRLDGREIGATPIFRMEVPVGRHVVKLVSPDSGEVRLTRTITIKADDLTKVIAN